MILFLIMWQLYRKKQLNKLLFFYLMHVGGSWSTWDEGRTYSAPNRTAMQRCSPIAPTAAQIITESIYYRSYSCCETSGVVTQTIRSRWLQWDSNKRVVWSASICLRRKFRHCEITTSRNWRRLQVTFPMTLLVKRVTFVRARKDI